MTEILVGRHDGTLSYGTGYQLSPHLVLTARHVLDDAATVDVRFFPGATRGEEIRGEVAWAGATADLALVRLTRPFGTEDLSSPELGDLPALVARAVPFQALGFPTFSTKPGATTTVRDTASVTGEIPPLANAKTGRLQLRADVPEGIRGEDWTGFSGAAIFAHDRLVGLVAEVEPGGFLTAVRLAAVFEEHDTAFARDREAGENVAVLRQLLADDGLAVRFVPARRPTTQTDFVRWLDARSPRLEGRDTEIEELRAFTLSDRPFAWWTADPWSGKTTLAAHTAAHPVDGVDVVSFFFSRARATTEIRRFLESVCEQLAALLDREAPREQGHEAFVSLWQQAQAHQQRLGRHLVLLVDGADEAEDPGRLLGLLPPDRLPSTHVLVFSRRNVHLPARRSEHPLLDERRTPRRPLRASPFATGRQQAAEDDLEEYLDDPAARTMLCLLAAAGPLTVNEAAALAKEDSPATGEYEVRRVFERVAARIVEPIPLGGETRFAFQHSTLREATAGALADRIPALRTRIHEWAAGYAAAGWPDNTPDYLADGYPQLLQELREAELLTRLVSVPRIRFLTARQGSTHGALREIDAALATWCAAPRVRLDAVAVLAVAREKLRTPIGRCPVDVALGWVRAGDWRRAHELAEWLEGTAKARALAAVAVAAWRAGSTDEAVALARGVPDPEIRCDCFADLLAAATGAEQTRLALLQDAVVVANELSHPHERAVRLARIALTVRTWAPAPELAMLLRDCASLARSGGSPWRQGTALSAAAEAAAALGEIGLAGDLVSAVLDKHQQGQAALAVAAQLAPAGHDVSLLLTVVERAADDQPPAKAATLLARAAALPGTPQDRATALRRRAEELAFGVPDPQSRNLLIATLVEYGAADVPALVRAVTAAARAEQHGSSRVRALSALALAVGRRDSAVLAADLLESAVEELDGEGDPARREKAAVLVGEAAASLGRVEAVTAALGRIASAAHRARVLARLAAVLAARSDRAAAETAARARAEALAVPPGVDRPVTLAQVAVDVPAHRQELLAAAEESVSPEDDGVWRSAALAAVAQHRAAAGDLGSAGLAIAAVPLEEHRRNALSAVLLTSAAEADVEWSLAVVRSENSSPAALAAVARAALASGRRAPAAELARRLPDRDERRRLLEAVVRAMLEAGEWDGAIGTVAAEEDRASGDHLRRVVAMHAASTGHEDEAVALVGQIDDLETRDDVLATVVAAYAGRGDLERALRTAAGLQTRSTSARALTELACRSVELGRAEEATEILRRAMETLKGTPDAVAQETAALLRFYAAAGLERALPIADSFGQPVRGILVTALAGAAVDRSALGDCVAIIPRLDRDEQQRHLARTARLALQLGDYVQAATLTARSLPTVRRRNFLDVLQAAVHAGDDAAALRVARSIEEHEGPEAVTEAARIVQRDLDRFDLAERIARAIEESGWRQRALAAVAVEACGVGRVDDALALLAATGIATSRPEVLVECARRVGDRGSAPLVADLRRTTASPATRAAISEAAAEAALDRGHDVAAREIVEAALAEPAEERDVERLETVLVRVLFEANFANETTSAPRAVSPATPEPRAGLPAAAPEPEAEETGGALPAVLGARSETSATVPAPSRGSTRLSTEADFYAAVVDQALSDDRVGLARAAAQAPRDLQERSALYRVIVAWLCAHHDYSEAARTARRIEHVQVQADTLASVAEQAAQAGLFAEAAEVARTISVRSVRRRSLDVVARAATALGDYGLALRCVGSPTEASDHVDLLGTLLADTMEKRDDWLAAETARRAAELLVIGTATAGAGGIAGVVGDLRVRRPGAEGRFVAHLLRARVTPELCAVATDVDPDAARPLIAELTVGDLRLASVET
ncbi:trypsin-like peptidase domain-containing protein [Geodermatophilus sp. CPCC 205506]|uniref:trypsin-like peptidase domain-containing protein n=1 Tax=Geodermatophilus sp. CPCC 205506 TaxID=2936596 RepID=UPI003EE8CDC5